MLPLRSRTGVQLDGALSSPEVRPGKERQTQVDGSGVEGIDGLRKFQSEAVSRVQALGFLDQELGEIGVDAPVPLLVGVGQRAARNPAPEPHVIQLLRHGTKARLDIPEALSKRELSEDQTQELVPAGKAAAPPHAGIPFNAPLKRLVGGMLDYLSEYGASLIHRLSCAREGNRMSRNPLSIQIVSAPRATQAARSH
jgi:hypothetical protein